MKMILETKKILENPDIQVTATAVRVPVMGGHSESINVSFHHDFEWPAVLESLQNFPGITVVDDIQNAQYPMPLIHAHDSDQVFVGRLRRDDTAPNTLNAWVVSDNLRKGAATNAVQIAEYIFLKK
jgi:aspartate-semialdehyde dehydrogenase